MDKEFELIQLVCEQMEVTDQLHALTAFLTFLSKMVTLCMHGELTL